MWICCSCRKTISGTARSPPGRLREPLAAAATADAVLVAGDDLTVARVSRAAGVPRAFRLIRHPGTARWAAADQRGPVPEGTRVFAVAAIARPERFFRDAAAAGFDVCGAMAFRDHHHFTESDLGRIRRASAEAHAEVILTTEKDAVRIAGRLVGDPPLAILPLVVAVAPPLFYDWLASRIAEARRHPMPA